MLYGLVSETRRSEDADPPGGSCRINLTLVGFFSYQPPFYSRNTAEMYNNILHKAPAMKPNVSNAGRELLEGLLQKERTKRLGAKDDFVSVLSRRESQTHV